MSSERDDHMKDFRDRVSCVSQWDVQREKGGSDTFLQLYIKQVQEQPDAVALVSDESLLTYQALDRYANQVALFLRGRGMGQQGVVGICLPRGLLLIIALLGVLK